MKKKIVITAFILLIAITVIVFTVIAIHSYFQEIAHDDILTGFGAMMIAALGGLVMLYELDLFYTVYQIVIKPKNTVTSVLHGVANITLLLAFFGSDPIAHFLFEHVSAVFGEEVILLFAFLFIYVVLRVLSVISAIKRPHSPLS